MSNDFDPSSQQRLSMHQPSSRRMMTSDLGSHSVQIVPEDFGSINGVSIQPGQNHSTERFTWSAMDGQVSNEGVKQYNSVNSSQLGRKDGLFASAQTANGSPVVGGNLKPSDTINVGGMRTTVESAMAAGLMYQDANGAYRIADGAGPQEAAPPPQHSQQQQQDAPLKAETQGGDAEQVAQFQQAREQGFEMMDDKSELAISKMIAPTPQPVFDKAMASAIEKGLDGVDWNEIAQTSNITPEEAKERGAVMQSMMVAKANQITKDSGISDPQRFYQWLAQKSPEAFSKAQRDLFVNRDSKTLKDAISIYKTRISPSEADYRSSGYETRKEAGALMVKVDGQWYSSDYLVRNGKITHF